MIRPEILTPLLSNVDPIGSLGKHFRSNQPMMSGKQFVMALIAMAIVMTIVAIGVRWVNRRQKYGYRSPKGLLYSLCRAHKINLSGCWLLYKLARHQKLANPGALFLQPELFDVQNPSRWLAQRTNQLQNLRDTIFERPLTE